MQLKGLRWPLVWIALCWVGEIYSQESMINSPLMERPNDMAIDSNVQVGVKPMVLVDTPVALMSPRINQVSHIENTPLTVMSYMKPSTPETPTEVRKTRKIVQKKYSDKKSRKYSAILLQLCSVDYRKMADDYHQVWLMNPRESNGTSDYPPGDLDMPYKPEGGVPSLALDKQPHQHTGKDADLPDVHKKSQQPQYMGEQTRSPNKSRETWPGVMKMKKTGPYGARVQRPPQSNNVFAPNIGFRAEGQMKNDAILGPNNVLKGSLHAGTDNEGNLFMHGQHSLSQEPNDGRENAAPGSKSLNDENISAHDSHGTPGGNRKDMNGFPPSSKIDETDKSVSILKGVIDRQNNTIIILKSTTTQVSQGLPKDIIKDKLETEGIPKNGSALDLTKKNGGETKGSDHSYNKHSDHEQQGRISNSSVQHKFSTNAPMLNYVSTQAISFDKQIGGSQESPSIYGQDRLKETSTHQPKPLTYEKKMGDQASILEKTSIQTTTLSFLEKAVMVFAITETPSKENSNDFNQASETIDDNDKEHFYQNSYTLSPEDNGHTAVYENQQTPSNGGEGGVNPKKPADIGYTLTTESHQSFNGKANPEPTNLNITGDLEENTGNPKSQPEPQIDQTRQEINKNGETYTSTVIPEPNNFGVTGNFEGCTQNPEIQPEPELNPVTEGNTINGGSYENSDYSEPTGNPEGYNQNSESEPVPESNQVTEGNNDNGLEYGSPAYPEPTGNPEEYTQNPEIQPEPELNQVTEGNTVNDVEYGSPAYPEPSGNPEIQPEPELNQVTEGNTVNDVEYGSSVYPETTGNSEEYTQNPEIQPEPELNQVTGGNTVNDVEYRSPVYPETTGNSTQNPEIQPEPELNQVTEGNTDNGVEYGSPAYPEPIGSPEGYTQNPEIQPEPELNQITEKNAVNGEGYGIPAYPEPTGNPEGYTENPESQPEPELSQVTEEKAVNGEAYGSPDYPEPTGNPEGYTQIPESQPEPELNQVTEENTVNGGSYENPDFSEPTGNPRGYTQNPESQPEPELNQVTEENTSNSEAYGVPAYPEPTENSESQPEPQPEENTNNSPAKPEPADVAVIGSLDSQNETLQEQATEGNKSGEEHEGPPGIGHTPDSITGHPEQYTENPEGRPEPRTDQATEGNSRVRQLAISNPKQTQRDNANENKPNSAGDQDPIPERELEPTSVDSKNGVTKGAHSLDLQFVQNTESPDINQENQRTQEPLNRGVEVATVVSEPQLNQADEIQQTGGSGSEQITDGAAVSNGNDHIQNGTPEVLTSSKSSKIIDKHTRQNSPDKNSESSPFADGAKAIAEHRAEPDVARNTLQEKQDNTKNGSKTSETQQNTEGVQNVESLLGSKGGHPEPITAVLAQDNETDQAHIEPQDESNKNRPEKTQNDQNLELKNQDTDRTNTFIDTETTTETSGSHKKIEEIACLSTTQTSNLENSTTVVDENLKNLDTEISTKKLDHAVSFDDGLMDETKDANKGAEKNGSYQQDSQQPKEIPGTLNNAQNRENAEENTAVPYSTTQLSQQAVDVSQSQKKTNEGLGDVEMNIVDELSSSTTLTPNVPTNEQDTETLLNLEKSGDATFSPKQIVTVNKLENGETVPQVPIPDIVEDSSTNISQKLPQESSERAQPETEMKLLDKVISDHKKIDLASVSNKEHPKMTEPAAEPVYSAEKLNLGAQTNEARPQKARVPVASPTKQKNTDSDQSQFDSSAALRLSPSITGDYNQGWGLFNAKARAPMPQNNNGQYNFFANLFVTQSTTTTTTSTTTVKPIQMRKAPSQQDGMKYKWGWF